MLTDSDRINAFDSDRINALEGVKNITVENINAESLDYDKETEKKVLTNFINKVRNNVIDAKSLIKYVEELKTEDFINIYTEVYNQSLSVYSELDISIILSCIKHLLIKCDHYYQSGGNDYQVVNDILKKVKIYLQENINHILLVKDQTIRDCEDSNPGRPVVEVCCPCRKLKTVFYQQIPSNDDILNAQTVRMKDQSRSAMFISSRDVINWPNVGISIVFPNFQITHRNMQQSKFKLIKLDPKYKPNAPMRCTKLKYKALPGNSETIKTGLVCEYINQVKQFIRVTCNVRIGKKVDMLSILSEFKSDVELCNGTIETNTEFYAPTSKYPYVRYLGQSLAGECDEPILEYSEQVKVDKDKTNIRLQEMAHPIIMFSLGMFSVPYEMDEKNEYKFTMDEACLPSSKNDWLVYECLVCEKKYTGMTATEEIGRHLLYEHGMEPDWMCTKCKVSFSTRKLSCDRWHHECKDTSKKFKKKK